MGLLVLKALTRCLRKQGACPEEKKAQQEAGEPRRIHEESMMELGRRERPEQRTMKAF